jgi:hypothetical protein
VNYIARLFNATDPTASLKHAAYAVVVVFCCAWLSFALVKYGLTSEWVASLTVLVGAVTVGKVVGSGPSPAPTAGAVGDTIIKTDEVKP